MPLHRSLEASAVKSSIPLVTGANRGIGKAFVTELLQAGVDHLYAAARNPASLSDLVALAPERVVPVMLDITNPTEVKKAVEMAGDVSLLVNNAGVNRSTGLMTERSIDDFRVEMNTNLFGTLNMARAFSPVLGFNGGGCMINMLSVVSIASGPWMAGYSASKAALHSITQALRAELRRQNTLVIGVFSGPVRTAMTEHLSGDKADPRDIVAAALAAVDTGLDTVFPDPVSETLLEGLKKPLRRVEDYFAAMK